MKRTATATTTVRGTAPAGPVKFDGIVEEVIL